MRSKAQFSGVRRASRPTFVNVCMMHSSFLQVFWHLLPSRSGCKSIQQSTHLSEALAQFGYEQLRLFKCSEVTTFRNLVPVEEIRVGLIAPYLRRREKVAFKDTHRDRQFEGHSDEILRETLVIEPRRRRSGVGQPVKSDVIQHVIDRDGLRRITLVVAPGLKLLIDPHCLPNRRVGKTVPECLWPRPLDGGIPRGIARVPAEVIQRLLLGGRIAPRWRWWWRK